VVQPWVGSKRHGSWGSAPSARRGGGAPQWCQTAPPDAGARMPCVRWLAAAASWALAATVQIPTGRTPPAPSADWTQRWIRALEFGPTGPTDTLRLWRAAGQRGLWRGRRCVAVVALASCASHDDGSRPSRAHTEAFLVVSCSAEWNENNPTMKHTLPVIATRDRPGWNYS
jgi:hypothetical protein